MIVIDGLTLEEAMDIIKENSQKELEKKDIKPLEDSDSQLLLDYITIEIDYLKKMVG